MKNIYFPKKKLGALLLVSGLVLPLLTSTPALAAGSISPVDTSDAIRWEADGTPIGDIVYEFIDRDDTTKAIDAPFPINFFGQRYPALCLSTNGVINPISTTSATCSARFDRAVEYLSLEAQAPTIAALALDLDLGEEIHNPQRESTQELQVTSVTAASGVLTVTTSGNHGFRVGELAKTSTSSSFVCNDPDNCFGFRGRVLSVPSSNTYTVATEEPIADGTYTPQPGERAVAYREVIFERVASLSLAGTTLTVTSNGEIDFGNGGKFTFNGTGVAALDGAKLNVLSRIDNNTFTVTVPSTLVDLDSAQAGSQTERTYESNQPWALERDNVGAIQQAYFGATTVNGRDAYSYTLYRTGTNDTSTNGINGGRFPAVNPETLSITLQLLIIKKTTGSDAAGWDFDIEVNIGHATDASDGYKSTDGNSSCSSSSLADLQLCRWGIGTAKYFAGPAIESISDDGQNITVNTVTAHGFSVGRGIKVTGTDGTSRPFDGIWKVSAVVDSNTVVLNMSTGATFSEEPAEPGSRLGYAQSWELFPNTSVLDLRDAGGAKALVRNSLNSPVLGRYTFAMVGGQVKNFEAPTMGAGVSTAPGVELANTGIDNGWLLVLSAMFIAAGSLMVTRKRRTE